jgi:hypothetical protein
MAWRYGSAVGRIRKRIASLPEGARVLVASGGDERLVAEDSRSISHFPRPANGTREGLPPEGAAAIAHLEELRAEGAEWLVFPSMSLWWLDHDPELHHHLLTSYEAVAAPEDDCLLFRLTNDEDHASEGASMQMFPIVGQPGLVSVVVAYYEQKRFLTDAIESVLDQTYPRVEVVFVNDGSRDRPYKDIVSLYPGVRGVWQRNQGLAAARNRGLEEARGAYVVFLDADDRLLPNAIATNIQMLYRHPEAAFAAGFYRVIDAEGSFVEQYERQLIEDPLEALLEKNFIGHHGAVMYRRAVFDEVGDFDVTLSACEDYDLYLRIARRFPFVHCDDVIAEYRRHDGNMSNDDERMLRTVMRVLSAQREVVQDDPRLEAALDKGIERCRKLYGPAGGARA